MLAQAHSEIICGFFFLTDYKQKYGEEHGSCQAGIAGVFMEVRTAASPVHTYLFVSKTLVTLTLAIDVIHSNLSHFKESLLLIFPHIHRLKERVSIPPPMLTG